MTWGNQHFSRKADLMEYLHSARRHVGFGNIHIARSLLAQWRKQYALVPASTKRRWKCGR